MNIVPQAETDATSSASYWGVIPAPVRYCKSLPPAAKLLFTEITALCKREGYCWATNAHFQALYEVERYTVQRWISALVREGFIRVELGPGPSDRRIYDLTAIPQQKIGGGVSKKIRGGNKIAPNPPQKSGTEWYTKNKEKKEIESDARDKFVGPGPVAARELQAQEEKVAASPSTVKSKSEICSPSSAKLRQVMRVVTLVRDVSGKAKLEALWDALHDAGRAEVWQNAVTALKASPARSQGHPAYLLDRFIFLCTEAAGLTSRPQDRSI